MESLSDDAQDPDSTEYLEAKVLNGQWTELNEVEAALEHCWRPRRLRLIVPVRLTA